MNRVKKKFKKGDRVLYKKKGIFPTNPTRGVVLDPDRYNFLTFVRFGKIDRVCIDRYLELDKNTTVLVRCTK